MHRSSSVNLRDLLYFLPTKLYLSEELVRFLAEMWYLKCAELKLHLLEGTCSDVTGLLISQRSSNPPAECFEFTLILITKIFN